MGYLKKRSGGFSLIELSVFISIAAIIAIGYLEWLQPPLITDSVKSLQTMQKMQKIINSIENFRIRMGRLPCPADRFMRADNTRASGAPTDSHVNDFAREDLDFDQTDGTLGVDCSSTFGIVPVSSLGLDSNYINDGWGRRISYHVSSNLCANDADLEEGCGQRDYEDGINGTAEGDITVTDGSNNLTTVAAYVLVSHGSNGNGGYLPSGEKIADGSGNELENSDVDQTYVKADITSDFDDIVEFRTRDQIELLIQDTSTSIVSEDFCQQNSVAISEIDQTEASAMESNIDDYEISNANTGDHVVFSVLWSIQSACIGYYSAAGSGSWTGPQCPGGGTYNSGDNSCSCASGNWNGAC